MKYVWKKMLAFTLAVVVLLAGASMAFAEKKNSNKLTIHGVTRPVDTDISVTVGEETPPEKEQTPAQDEPEKQPAQEEAAKEELPEQEETVEDQETYRNAVVLLSEGAKETPLYAEASASSTVLEMIPNGAALGVAEIGDTWSSVAYGNLRGYVATAAIVLYNDTLEEDNDKIRSITVTTNVDGQSEVEMGTAISMKAQLYGFENDAYVLQWQYTPDGGATVVDIPGANSNSYTFTIDENNASYMWRLNVRIQETEQPTN